MAHILIVEDDPIIAWDLQRQLMHLDRMVLALASSAQEAFAQVQAQRPEVVLMDIRLHGEIDGLAVGQDIQATYGIPVIYLLAYVPAQLGKRTGYTAPLYYLVKPMDREALHRTLEQAGAGGQQPQDRRASPVGGPSAAIRRSLQVLWETLEQARQEACEANQQAAQIWGRAKEARRETRELYDVAMRRLPEAEPDHTPQDEGEDQHPS